MFCSFRARMKKKGAEGMFRGQNPIPLPPGDRSHQKVVLHGTFFKYAGSIWCIIGEGFWRAVMKMGKDSARVFFEI